MYGIAGLALAFELGVAWLALHPEVPPEYRAYYIDHTTTCLPQPVSGAYEFGTLVSFRSEGAALIKPLRVCGWEGPAGDGLHSVGESSQLRFALPDETGPLTLSLDLDAVPASPTGTQQVAVSANGVELGVLTVSVGSPQTFTLPLPATCPRSETLEVELAYPDAVLMSQRDTNTRKRAVRLTRAGVTDR